MVGWKSVGWVDWLMVATIRGCRAVLVMVRATERGVDMALIHSSVYVSFQGGEWC